MKTPESDVKIILVVEDEPAICELCRRVLSIEGFKVDIAVNGKAAQEMIEKRQYDLYLLDVKLPVITGKELYQYMKGKHPQMINRVIFTSGSVVSGDTQSFLEQTGRPYLPKPFTATELIAIVRKTLKEVEK